MLFVPFLGGKDFEYLYNPSKAPVKKAVGDKEAHLDRGIETQCLSTFPALHARHPYEWAILRRPCKVGRLSTAEPKNTTETYKSNTLRISWIFVCFSP